MKRVLLFFSLLLIGLVLLCGIASADTLIIPGRVTEIQEETFYGDSSLDEVVLPDGVSTIGTRAFANSSVRKINLPRTISLIRDDAFSGCTRIRAQVYKNSYAHRFCVYHSIPYDLIPELSFVLQPETAVVEKGQNAVFTVEGILVNEYTWQRSFDNGKTWSTFSAGTTSGNRNQISVAGTEDNEKYAYRCRITDNKGNKLYSDIVRIVLFEQEIPAEEIQISQNGQPVGELYVAVGSWQTVTVAVSPADTTQPTLSYSCSNSAVAYAETSTTNTATAQNRVNAVSPGESVLTVKASNGISSTLKIHAVRLTLNETLLLLDEGETYQLVPVIEPSGLSDNTVEYVSSDPQHVSVDRNGLIKVHQLTDTDVTITATTRFGQAVSTVTVHTVRKVQGITLSNSSLDIQLGSSATLSSSVWPEDASTNTVRWTSSDTSIATVDSTGKITGKKAGTVTITAIADDNSYNSMASCIVCIQSIRITKQPEDVYTNVTEIKQILTGLSTKEISFSVIASNVNTYQWQELGENGWTDLTGETATTSTFKPKVSATLLLKMKNADALSYRCKLTGTDGSVVYTREARLSCNLKILPSASDIGSSAGSVSIKVTAVEAWTLECGSSWIQTNVSSGTSGEKTITVAYDANPNPVQRTANIVFTCGEAKETYEIRQKAGDIKVSSIRILYGNQSITSAVTFVNYNNRLTAEVEPSNALNKTVVWTSSNDSVVSVDSYTGAISAKKEGTAVIKASATDGSNVFATCSITVTVPVSEINITYNGKAIKNAWMNAGTTNNLITAQALPSNATNKTVTWSSSNPSVLKVTESNGTVRVEALKKGNADLIAIANDRSETMGSCHFVVRQPVLNIELEDIGSDPITVGETRPISVTSITPGDANNKILRVSSSNPDVAKVISVNTAEGSDYTESFVILGINEGTAVITVSALDNGPASASCTVTVLKAPSGPASSGMSTSAAGINYIKTREGSGHTTAYWDSLGGKWTIGYGHTDGVYEGQTITDAQAEQLLQADLRKYEKIVNDFCSNYGVYLTQSQFDAIVSLSFNAGEKYLENPGFKLHDTLVEYKNASNIPVDRSFRMFGAIHHSNHSCVPGLFYRRCDEGAMFTYGEYNVRYDWRTDYFWWDEAECVDLMPDNWYPYEYGYSESGSSSSSGSGQVTDGVTPTVTNSEDGYVSVKWNQATNATHYDLYFFSGSVYPSGNTWERRIRSYDTSVAGGHSLLSCRRQFSNGTYYVWIAAVGSGDDNWQYGEPVMFTVSNGPQPGTGGNGIVIAGVSIGYGDGSYFTKNGQSCATDAFANGRCHKHDICIEATDYRCNCMRYWPSLENYQVDLLSSQCLGFVRFCEWKVYGHFDNIENYGNNDPNFKKAIGYVSRNDCTEGYLKSLIQGCPAATHVRLNGYHSIVIISTGEAGVYWADCNSDGYCKVVEHYQTWDEFASYIRGKGGITYVAIPR